MLQFKPFSARKPGTVYDILCWSYLDLEVTEPQLVADWKKSWKRYDDEIFQSLETTGKAGFFTLIDQHCIGFASYDPRQLPNKGIIGHNCILPECRGKGYGKAQIIEIIGIMRAKGCVRIEATTGNHSFFKPAYEMYRSCGFLEQKRASKDSVPFELITMALVCEGP